MADRDRAAEIAKRSLENEGFEYRCESCEKTPQDVGWCEECGYNRDYYKIRRVTVQ